MSTPASRPATGRRRSVAGVAFAPQQPISKLDKMALISGVAVASIDKENLTRSPRAGNQKKRKARVSFANTDELLYFNTDDSAAGLVAQPPTPKKLSSVSTPTRKRASLAPIEPSKLENREDASKVLQTAHEATDTQLEEVHRVREEEIEKDSLPIAIVDASEASVSASIHEKSASESILDHSEEEFTLEDVLAENNADLDMAALTSAADDELSAIYATGSGVRASTMPISDLSAHESDTSVGSLKIEEALRTALEDPLADQQDSESHTWKSLMGSRRDSLSLPSLARRDSFSLNSTRHLLSHAPEPTSLASMLPQSQSRRQSLLMETTQSDLGAILSAQVDEEGSSIEKSTKSEEVDPEATVRFSAPKSKSRRASLAMDMTNTDLGQIIMLEENTFTLSAAPRLRRQSMMDMTVTDLGSIALREEEPMEMDEDEAAHETIRMELTRTDLGEFLMDDTTTTMPTEVRVKFKNRRQSLAMDETQSNFGTILDAHQDTTTLSGLTQQLNDTNQDTSTLNMSVLETAEERAMKPSSNLLSLLPSSASLAKTDTTGLTSIAKLRSRRQSLAMDMTISNFGEILVEAPEEPSMELETYDNTNTIIESAEKESQEEEEAMEMTQNFSSSILGLNDDLVADAPSGSPDVIESPSEIEDMAQEEAMEMTRNFSSFIDVAESGEVPIAPCPSPSEQVEEDQDTMELPVLEGTVVVGEEAKMALPSIMITAPSDLALTSITEDTADLEEAKLAQKEMFMEQEERFEGEEFLLDNAVSTTTTLTNLSFSLSSRDGLRSIIEAAVAQSTVNEKETTISLESALLASSPSSAIETRFNGPSTNTSLHESHIGPKEATWSSQIEETSVPPSESLSTLIHEETSAGEIEMDTSNGEEAPEPAFEGEILKSRSLPSSRRQSKSGSARPSLIDNTLLEDEEEMVEVMEDTMSMTQMNSFLAEDTRKLMKRSKAKPAMDSFALLSSVAPGSPMMGSLHEALNSSQAPLLTALQNAIPSVVPRIVTEVSFNHGGSYSSGPSHMMMPFEARNMDEVENVGNVGNAMEIDNNDMESNDGTVTSLRYSGSQSPESQLENDEMEDDDCMGDDASARLDLAQKQFESHVEAQLRTPGIRKSLLAASSFTPFAAASMVSASGGSSGMAMYPSSGPMTMTMTSMAGTMTLSNLGSTSFARFLANFGVNFLDGITNRRQSLGVRVPEPNSEYDRMMTKLKSTPELELSQRVFLGLNELLSECERGLINLEDQCREQCSEKMGVYQLFIQCITTHQDAARKDLAILKQVAQADAKLHLNQRYIGYYFEEQLYQTLQITLATAKAHLAQIEDQQTATITTKLAMAKQHSNAHVNKINAFSAPAQVSVTTQQLKDAQNEFGRLEASEDFLKTIQGWQLVDSTHTSQIFDYRNAVELKVELQNGVEIASVELSSVLGAKTEEEESERQLVEKMLAAMDVKSYVGSQSMFAVINDVTTKVGRVLELANEIRQLYRSYFIESVDLVPNVGIAVSVRFSNPESGVRYMTRLIIGAQYPFVEEMPVSVDARFGGVDAVQVAQIVEEEVDKHGYKLMTRVCKRLDRLCSVN